MLRITTKIGGDAVTIEGSDDFKLFENMLFWSDVKRLATGRPKAYLRMRTWQGNPYPELYDPEKDESHALSVHKGEGGKMYVDFKKGWYSYAAKANQGAQRQDGGDDDFGYPT